jgi:tetratricopeptide (TPR) repeat protein
MKAGQYDAAIDDLKRAMEYPKNLGVGRPHKPDFSRQFYYLGLCYRAIHQSDLATEFLTKAADTSSTSPWPQKARKALNANQ